MLELAVFDDLAELRDAALILVATAASLVALLFLLGVLKLSTVAYRVVRRLERFHEQRIAGTVTQADERLVAWLEQDRWSARGLWELLQLARERVERRREPPPKRRFFGILPPTRR